MNRPKGQQCLAKAIELKELTPYISVTVRCQTRHAHINRQYAILRLARFTEPLPDNKEKEVSFIFPLEPHDHTRQGKMTFLSD